MQKMWLLVGVVAACGSSGMGGAADAPVSPPDGAPDGVTAADAAPDGVATIDAAPADAPPVDAGSADAAPVTLTVAKQGQGSVTSTPAGIDCAAACPSASASFSPGTSLVLEAKPAAGFYFQGWTSTSCGTRRFCSFTLAATTTVTARFVPIDHNLVFATSTKYDGNLGGVDGADDKCGEVAASAGLSGTFVAYLSTETVNAHSRLVVPGTATPARGFVRLDGLPVSDTVNDLAVVHRLWYAVKYDENGEPLDWFGDATWTGSTTSGESNLGQTCDSFTTAAMDKFGRFGEAAAGPHMWMSSNPANCMRDDTYYPSGQGRLYCFMVDKTAPVAAPAPVPGKRIYVTKAVFVPGGGIDAANAACGAEKPSGATSVKALLATNGTAAATLLHRQANYVRPDGVLVGTGQDLVDASQGKKQLAVGPWQTGDGTYVADGYFAFTGSPLTGAGLEGPGAADTTCENWTSIVGRGTGGIFQRTSDSWWNQYNGPCDQAGNYRLYCVED